MGLLANTNIFGQEVTDTVLKLYLVEGSKEQGWKGWFKAIAPNGEQILTFNIDIPYSSNPYTALENTIRQMIIDDQQEQKGYGKRFSNPRIIPD